MSFVNLEKVSRLEKCRQFGTFATITNVARQVGNTRAEINESIPEILRNSFKISLTVFLTNATNQSYAISHRTTQEN